ncbi:hypothetical protein N489_05625 [Lactococcus lactis subsp. lactis 1AA59]|nr:hypothetical protein N489_05625 [Lactococcus lactis subsp. lactis 1AA59]
MNLLKKYFLEYKNYITFRSFCKEKALTKSGLIF